MRVVVSCPCESGSPYQVCCGPIHDDGAGLGKTAEQLMRARYSAYVQRNADFLLQSWHPDTRPRELSFDPDHVWLGLTIEATTAGGGLDAAGTVEFRATFRRGRETVELHELSSFVRLSGKWVYTDGVNPAGLT